MALSAEGGRRLCSKVSTSFSRQEVGRDNGTTAIFVCWLTLTFPLCRLAVLVSFPFSLNSISLWLSRSHFHHHPLPHHLPLTKPFSSSSSSSSPPFSSTSLSTSCFLSPRGSRQQWASLSFFLLEVLGWRPGRRLASRAASDAVAHAGVAGLPV